MRGPRESTIRPQKGPLLYTPTVLYASTFAAGKYNKVCAPFAASATIFN
jgi:hypothetical protein